MSRRAIIVAGLTAAAFAATPAAAQSVETQLQTATEGASDASDVSAEAINAFAAANPVADAAFAEAPAVGATVAEDVALSPVSGFAGYSYTYYEGRPVIVSDADRSVVFLGE